MANDTLFRRFAPYKRKQTGDESPLLKEGVTARIAVTGDCPMRWLYPPNLLCNPFAFTIVPYND